MGLEQERKALYWLCRSFPAAAVTIKRIGTSLDGFADAYYIEGSALRERGVLKNERAVAAFEAAKAKIGEAQEEYLSLGQMGCRFVTPLEEDYPKRLRLLHDHPMGLWVKGELPKESQATVAIVGSRNATSYGEQAAKLFGRELAASGVQVISGLALGIDAKAHLGAIEGGGDTFAVLGCGVNVCYPKANYPIWRQMETRGGLMSEFSPGISPKPNHFPIRNRIISGLSDAILVMEARQKSGSLITAQLGLDQGKEVFALPGRATDLASRGCNQLIQSGAALLGGPGDVLEYLGILREKKLILYEKTGKGLAKREKMVYSFLDSAPRHAEEIAQKAGLPIAECLGALLELELLGLAIRTKGQYYARAMDCGAESERAEI